MLMTDQDVDGSHIKGLFINFIHVLWPSLLKVPGFLREFVTPLLKASKGKVEKQFFSMAEYQLWLREVGLDSSWRVKYYKGLGTSTSAEARAYFSDLPRHVKDFTWSSKEDDASLELAFERSEGTISTDRRKRWLQFYDPNTAYVERGSTYSEFVNKELVAFSFYRCGGLCR